MPKIEKYKYILGYFEELGRVSRSGDRFGALTFTEISSYMSLMNLKLTPYETSLIRTTSLVYSNCLLEFQQEAQAPYLSDKNIEIINKVGMASFKRMAKK